MNRAVKLGDLVNSYSKGITPSYVDVSDTVVLNQKCIRNNTIDFSLARYHDSNKKFSDSNIVRLGDILINSTGQGTAGRVAFVRSLPTSKTVIVDSHILIVRIPDFFIAGLVESNLSYIETMLQTFMDGSTGQGEFDKEILSNLILKLPTDNNNRKYVYELIEAIETKIATNICLVDEIDKVTRLLYNYWFIQFDFPDHNGKPYKSSGGKMVYSSLLKREIPATWTINRLTDICDNSVEQLNPLLSPNKVFKLYSIPTFDSTGTYGLKLGSSIKSNKCVVSSNDVLVSKLNPWFKRVIFAPEENDLICSTEFVVMRQSDFRLKSYLYTIVRSESFISYCTSSSSGTSNSHRRVNPDIMLDFPFASDQNISKLFGEIIHPFSTLEAEIKTENQQLSKLKSWLLPLLMTGQVTIGEN